MPGQSTTRSELGRYFEEWLNTAFRNNLISRHKKDAMVRSMRGHLPELVSGLNRNGRARLGSGNGIIKFFLRVGRDPISGKFNWFEIQGKKKKPQKKLTCFLGHPFRKDITNCLRDNLRYVLEPSGIRLDWAGMDMNAVGFFDHLVKLIRKCDFCFFDNRLASEKPNVYIEAGIAYVLKKPFILADYHGNHRRSVGPDPPSEHTVPELC